MCSFGQSLDITSEMGYNSKYADKRRNPRGARSDGDNMDFFNVGLVLCALNFGFGSELNYIFRLVGAGFMAGGFRQLSLYYGDGRLDRHKGGNVLLLLFSAAGLAQALFLRFGMISAETGNILSTAAGLLCGGTVIVCGWRLIRQLTEDTSLVNDPSLLRGLSAAWKRYAVFAGITILAEAVGRFAVTDSMPHLVSGVAQAFSRIIMYIFIIIIAAAFNRCRMDFNKIHPE